MLKGESAGFAKKCRLITILAMRPTGASSSKALPTPSRSRLREANRSFRDGAERCADFRKKDVETSAGSYYSALVLDT